MAGYIAIAHVLGTLVVLVGLFAGAVALNIWEERSIRNAHREDVSLALGIPVDELNDDKHVSRVGPYLVAKFSSELLRNRLSDLVGWMNLAWGYLGILIQASVLLSVLWYTFSDDLSNAVHVWWMIPIAVFFIISSWLFMRACALLFGRAPGQARLMRKHLTKTLHLESTAVEGERDRLEKFFDYTLREHELRVEG